MKRIWLAVLSMFLAWPLAAQVQYDAPERQITEDMHNAFVCYHTLSKQQEQFKQEGMELSAADQQLLAQAQAQLKGVIVLELGYLGCQPCAALLNTLAQPSGSGSSMLQYWQNKGVRFYQVDVRRYKKLASSFGVRFVPVLLLFKDGELMTHDFGSGQMQSRLNGFDINEADDVLNMVKKWTDFALQ